MTRKRWARVAAALLVVALLLALLIPAIALGRAGGGHTSNPGRSSGGSSSSRSSSPGRSLGSAAGGMALGSAAASNVGGGGCCGFISLVIIIIVVFAIIQALKKRGVSVPTSPEEFAQRAEEFAALAAQAAPPSFDAVKATDPNFSEQLFYGRVNEMFLSVQKAWEARNMEPARRFLSQQQFEVLEGGVGEYVRNGQINKLDSIHIDKINPVSVTREGDSDYVKVILTATVIDYTIDERTGQIVNPDVLGDGKTPKTFDEYWTLVRKVGAVTKSDATIQKCPNCGGPVTDGNYVKCAYCGTMMNDPALDWVLLRIEQP
jgi:predicted lipid-binding transport protein (Tim44 family)